MKRPAYSVLILLLCVPFYGAAADISLGLGGFLTRSPYDAKRNDYSVWPVFNYDNDSWYIQGDEVGGYVLNDDTHELKVKAYYFDQEYQPKEGHGRAMRHLDKRHTTVMSGMSYQYTTAFGAIHTQLATDIRNRSQGVVANLAYLNMVQWAKLSLIPEVGLDWANGQQTRYYYGISSAESARSGLARYRPSANVTPYLSLMTVYNVTAHWNTYASARVNFLAATVRNSPIVNQDRTEAFSVGVNYNF
ncbi:MipA/OmpV family protein [Acerihabitans sp. TG2]|uniref:MipA/OmpV family protein n=1 Tax=Acerihabitans sp. TG2 TaxID=3096008 RepID=UPI002B22A7B1|nr:MipA/OmpV family protein [Acerihabitans sp. TG2]MEA9389668.1 MipA/OmpV family protein [Acerihabitans sp. TG2]